MFFDNIERAGIEIRDLFGKINEYLEGKKIKCVFIADFDNLPFDAPKRDVLQTYHLVSFAWEI